MICSVVPSLYEHSIQKVSVYPAFTLVIAVIDHGYALPMLTKLVDESARPQPLLSFKTQLESLQSNGYRRLKKFE